MYAPAGRNFVLYTVHITCNAQGRKAASCPSCYNKGRQLCSSKIIRAQRNAEWACLTLCSCRTPQKCPQILQDFYINESLVIRELELIQFWYLIKQLKNRSTNNNNLQIYLIIISTLAPAHPTHQPKSVYSKNWQSGILGSHKAKFVPQSVSS